MRKVLITGGLGFIGAHLTRRCLQKGYKVRLFDNGFRGQLKSIEPQLLKKVEWVKGDICHLASARRACKGMDDVYHLAAINGTRYFYEIPHHVLRINVMGTLTMLQAAQEARCQKFLFSSTSELYHFPSQIPTPETERILIPDITNPRFSYAGSKIIGELACLHQDPKRQIPAVIIRYHNIYGPRMGYEHVIPQLFTKICEASNNLHLGQATIPIQGSGHQTRAFCYVTDAVEATLLAMLRGKAGEIYHIGTDHEISIAYLIQTIGKVLKIKIKIQPGPLPAGDTPRRCPDIRKIKKLGYRPHVSLLQGLNETFRWYRNNPRQL